MVGGIESRQAESNESAHSPRLNRTSAAVVCAVRPPTRDNCWLASSTSSGPLHLAAAFRFVIGNSLCNGETRKTTNQGPVTPILG